MCWRHPSFLGPDLVFPYTEGGAPPGLGFFDLVEGEDVEPANSERL